MNKFGSILLGLSMGVTSMSLNAMEVNFNDPQEIDSWRIVNDGVMGGQSESQVNVTDGNLLFTGHVSLENNGGFASTRRTQLRVPQDTKSIRVKFKGDGKVYKLRLRDSETWDSISYSSNFHTEKDRWMELVFNQSDFEASWRGRKIKGAPKLNLSRVKQLGIMIADKQEGVFEIRINKIKFQK